MSEAPGGTNRQPPAAGSAEEGAEGAEQAAAALVALWEYAEIRDGADHSPTARRVLLTVQRLGPVTPGELCRALGITPAVASRTCARLAAAGLLERAPDPDDRRRTVLALAAAGRRSIEVWRAERTEALSARLNGTNRQHRALRAALGALSDRITLARAPRQPD